MVFPKWVSKARSKKAQATARLRYIIYRLAIEHGDSASIRAMCDATGVCKHSVVSLYVSQGAFSRHMAERFEAHFGSDVVKADQLVSPLDIEPKFIAK